MTGKFTGWCKVAGKDDLVCNYDGFGNEMVYRKGVNYRYAFEMIPNMYEPQMVVAVFIGKGMLYFSTNKFKQLFKVVGAA